MDRDRFQRRQRAAAIIQAFYRGYLARKAYNRLKNAAKKIQAHARGWYTRKKVGEERDRQAMAARFQSTMARHRERIYVLEKQKREVLNVPSKDIEQWDAKRHAAASKVQAAWRGFVQRRKWAASDPERLKRQAAAQQMQKAFRDIMNQNLHGGNRAPQPGDTILRSSVRQSATVLMGSPAKGVGSVGSAGSYGVELPSQVPGAARDGVHMSSKRYKDLSKGVDARVAAYKALAKHRRRDAHAVDTRLKELLNTYHATADDRLRAVHARQAALVNMETLVGGLEHGGLVPLTVLGDNPNPADFIRPPHGSERWERAAAAHALGLADARVGGAWWRHLKPLNVVQAQQALIDEDREQWECLDRQWRRQWEKVEEVEAKRPDPLAEFKRRGTKGQPPALSDIAVHEPDLDQAAGGKEGARTTNRPGAGARASTAVAQSSAFGLQAEVAGAAQGSGQAQQPQRAGVQGPGAPATAVAGVGAPATAGTKAAATAAGAAVTSQSSSHGLAAELGLTAAPADAMLPLGVARTQPKPPSAPPPPPSQVIQGPLGLYVAPKAPETLGGAAQHTTTTVAPAGAVTSSAVGATGVTVGAGAGRPAAGTGAGGAWGCCAEAEVMAGCLMMICQD